MHSLLFHARRRPLVGLLVTVGLLVFAVPASASSLIVTVKPTTIRVGHSFALKVRGTSDGPRQEVLVFSQKSSTRCAATSSAEFARWYTSHLIDSFVRPGPFQFSGNVTSQQAGHRRICAYLDIGGSTSYVDRTPC